jgi:hypothetical protein
MAHVPETKEQILKLKVENKVGAIKFTEFADFVRTVRFYQVKVTK